ncbi:MAG: sigma 54-interacting transcriptional regulator [Candidatus Competibacter sp.]
MSSSIPAASGTEIIVAASRSPLRVQFEVIDIRVISGPDSGQEARLGLPSVRIGTAPDNDLVLSDRAVSRRHAEIRMTSDGLLLRDLGSTNGTFINDVRITEAYVPENAECRLGYSRVLIRQHTEERKVAVPRQDHLGELVGASERMRELYGLIRAVAPTPTTVHLHGESGAGKELVARTLHALSGRSGPLVVFDASVADPEMVRNDLFGHIKGAFTGATGSREGAFRQAHTGTLFIDEIGELPLDLQPRLLRVLETREVTPIGSDKPLRVDVRVITATHRDLDAMVRAGTFRTDLFYRLSVVPVEVPSLREVVEDIPLITRHLCERMSLSCRISEAAMAALQRYSWPGNVRELRNVLERAAVMSGDREIQPEDLRLPKDARPSNGPPPSRTPASSAPDAPPIDEAETPAPAPKTSTAAARAHLKEVERQMILDSMKGNHNNKAAVARDLGIPLSTLKRRLKEYRISEED